ncbi:sensor histidine kinase [Halohasta litorea]|uniref:histidine kinase n=1 Tax=Halohasta litorea TaxID=869891 RepID=A0ABD6DEY3_9EURY|nr:sensor histidine kinase [Halohasta litorea]
MYWKRIIAGSIISITGIGLIFIVIQYFAGSTTNISGIIIAGAILVLGGAFGVGGAILYRSSVDSDHLLRVAGWNTLGVVVTTAVLGLVITFQIASGGRVSSPLLSGGIIVGVSAFAHVLIGFHDVRQIRARTVAKQRQKASVVNRFVRHNLRHSAQMLLGYGEQLRSDADITAQDRTDLGQKVVNIGSGLSDTQTKIKVIDDLVDRDAETYPINLMSMINSKRGEWEKSYPDMILTLDVTDDVSILAGDYIEKAISELVENACEYGGDPPEITIRGSQANEKVQIEICDNGDGFPEDEQQLINQDQDETKLQHSSGLGLWLSKWIVEYYDGQLSVETQSGDGGGKVTVTLPQLTN